MFYIDAEEPDCYDLYLNTNGEISFCFYRPLFCTRWFSNVQLHQANWTGNGWQVARSEEITNFSKVSSLIDLGRIIWL